MVDSVYADREARSGNTSSTGTITREVSPSETSVAASNGSISYSNFGLDAGILDSSGFVKLLSSECTDSKIRYGKFAMSRQGFTWIMAYRWV